MVYMYCNFGGIGNEGMMYGKKTALLYVIILNFKIMTKYINHEMNSLCHIRIKSPKTIKTGYTNH